MTTQQFKAITGLVNKEDIEVYVFSDNVKVFASLYNTVTIDEANQCILFQNTEEFEVKGEKKTKVVTGEIYTVECFLGIIIKKPSGNSLMDELNSTLIPRY